MVLVTLKKLVVIIKNIEQLALAVPLLPPNTTIHTLLLPLHMPLPHLCTEVEKEKEENTQI